MGSACGDFFMKKLHYFKGKPSGFDFKRKKDCSHNRSLIVSVLE